MYIDFKSRRVQSSVFSPSVFLFLTVAFARWGLYEQIICDGTLKQALQYLLELSVVVQNM